MRRLGTFIVLVSLMGGLAGRAAAEVEFEMVVTTDATGIEAEAVSGIGWRSVGFRSESPPFRAIISSRGVRGVAPDVDPSHVAAEEDARFAFLIEAAPDGFRVTALRGCRWTSLMYQCPGEGCAARLTHEGVRTAF